MDTLFTNVRGSFLSKNIQIKYDVGICVQTTYIDNAEANVFPISKHYFVDCSHKNASRFYEEKMK